MARMISLERSGFTDAVPADVTRHLCGQRGRPDQPNCNGWRPAEADRWVNRAGAQFRNDASQDNAIFPRLNRS